MKVKIERPEHAKATLKIARYDPRAPDFAVAFEEEDTDPLGAVEYDENDLETSADREMSELVRQIKAEKQAQYDRFRVARDPRYYVVVCFQSHTQRDEALQKLGWEVVWSRFVNGLDVCRMAGVEVAPIPLEPLPQRGKVHKFSREEVL